MAPSSPSRSRVSSYSFDDKDFDDDALWAAIDSTAAALSQATKNSSTVVGKSPKPLAIRYPNFNSPPTPVSHPSPQSKLLQHPNRISSFSGRLREEPPRPNKIARSCGLSDNPLALVKPTNRDLTPIFQSKKFCSPESYLSPEIRKSTSFAEFSPSVSCVKNDVNEMQHSLSGSFPSATLFKEFQNTAMKILEKPDYTMIHGNAYIKKPVEEDSLTGGAPANDVRRNFSNQITISLALQRPEPKTGLARIF